MLLRLRRQLRDTQRVTIGKPRQVFRRDGRNQADQRARLRLGQAEILLLRLLAQASDAPEQIQLIRNGAQPQAIGIEMQAPWAFPPRPAAPARSRHCRRHRSSGTARRAGPRTGRGRRRHSARQRAGPGCSLSAISRSGRAAPDRVKKSRQPRSPAATLPDAAPAPVKAGPAGYRSATGRPGRR